MPGYFHGVNQLPLLRVALIGDKGGLLLELNCQQETVNNNLEMNTELSHKWF